MYESIQYLKKQTTKENKNANKCKCGFQVVYQCKKCKIKICDDRNCGMDTVDGYLCGSYTQWGCGIKYTTCDQCLHDKAIQKEDLIQCDECNEDKCNKCTTENKCNNCNIKLCNNCLDDHECYQSE
jgi:hypothetical protein